MPAQVHIGCSGWQYRSWRGRFYPADLPAGRWLAYYTSVFDTVEINSSFYRLPERRTFAEWRRSTPAGFIAAVKASRYLTHLKRLRQPTQPLRRLFSRLVGLGDRLGPVLYQLPPQLAIDLDRLTAFLEALDRWAPSVERRTGIPMRHVVEFRHPSWYVRETYDCLRAHGVAFCVHDHAGSVSPREVTAPFVYVRFHGTTGKYAGSYDARALARWARWCAAQQASGLDVYAYFNNDVDGAATGNARDLHRRFLRGRPAVLDSSQGRASDRGPDPVQVQPTNRVRAGRQQR